MASLQGNIADIGIALQAAAGTAAATAQHRMRLSGGGFMEARDVEDIVESTGDVLLQDSFVARVRAEGTPQFVGRPNFLGLLAYAALGAQADTGAADPYTHTATLVGTPYQLPWLTVWTQLADGRRIRCADCKVLSLQLESSAGGLLIVTANIVGKTPVFRDGATYATENAVAVETANPFIHADASGALKVEGTAVSALQRVMASINNGGGAVYGDSITPDDITTARRTIVVETLQNIVDFGLWYRLHYGTATPTNGDAPVRTVMELGGAPAGIDFKWTRPGGPPARSVEILVPRLQLKTLTGLDYNANGDPIAATAHYEARRPAAGSGMSIITVNNVASYPGI